MQLQQSPCPPLCAGGAEVIPNLDHDDSGLNQSKVMAETSDISDVFMNVIDSHNLERDLRISLRNLRKLECAGKPVPTFPHPALAQIGNGRLAHEPPDRVNKR